MSKSGSYLMEAHLYFICPTDCLEPVINDTFRKENYYFTSLGNSITFSDEVFCQLAKLLQTKKIGNISFVLSDNNQIVKDALEKKTFPDVTCLNDFYIQMAKQKEYAEEVWQRCNHRFFIMSNHLNNKMKELRSGLKYLYLDPVSVDAKIYNTRKKAFSDVYSDIICTDSLSMN